MDRYIILVVLMFKLASTAFCQHTISGKVVSSQHKTPIAFAFVSLPDNELWATANKQGEFTIKNVPTGKITVTIQYLGYVKKVQEITVDRNISELLFLLQEDNLTLDEVVVTAKKGTELATSYLMDRTVLDHLQMLDVTDVGSLLPGGKTNTNLHLATSASRRFSINGLSGENGNPTFGVAVEVDGVRLSNNASHELAGTDTRNIASSNVESIEIVTGIASVEHGDMSNGMVKINTRKGKSPFIVDLATKPNTKQIALSKGFDLGHKNGVLNINIERTESISDLASPYTSYDRNGLSVNYSNTLNNNGSHPISLNIGISGNRGGFNSESDPDLFVNTYTKMKDDAVRANFSAKWLLNKSWITNVEAFGSVNYNDRITETSNNKSATASVAAIHATEEGYHMGQTYEQNPNADIILIPPGYWYELYFDDSKLLNSSARIKANWSRKFGMVNNNLMLGAEFSGSGNNGKGTYYDDMRYASTWREYRYDQEPNINNYAIYAEDNLTIPVHNRSTLQLIAGLRADITAIDGSEYGTISNLSPRFNARYTFWENAGNTVRDLSVKIGWGKTVKLPSFMALYPVPSYLDLLTFAPGTTSDGETFYAYYTMPSTRLYNPDLKWQHNIQNEISVNTNIGGIRISLTASNEKTYNPYISSNVYTPFSYKLTDQSHLENSLIPASDRIYTVDKNTGIVTVTDKTSTYPAEVLSYIERNRFRNNTMYTNGSPVERRRLTWIVDFMQIPVLKTFIRVDGTYYYYKGIEETITASMPNSAQNMADGNPYKYIGFYVGGSSSANGSLSKRVDMNITVTTHIPAIRLILSARVEGSFYRYDRNLSQYSNGNRGFVLDSRDGYFPSETETDIYGGDRFVALYPEYYISLDDMATKIPFAEHFAWAKENDVALYNELAKMVVKTNYNYYFNENHVSRYISANIGITKEIGNFASISFNATNFYNNMAKVHSSRNDAEYSLFDSSSIPALYYGLSLRLKL